jgi:hypothetical protein
MDVLARGIALEIMQSLFKKSRAFNCSECCPKPPPQPDVPDCVDLVDEVLSKAGVKRPVPMRMEVWSTPVTIFEGPYAGHFGIICQEELCSCCVFVKTIHEVVKVSRKHCNIHR